MSETLDSAEGGAAATETAGAEAALAPAPSADESSAQGSFDGRASAEESRVCRRLRTKTAFGTFRGNLYSWQSGRSTTAVYWCLRTMETVGPDDLYAHPHACNGARDCFEPPE